MPLGPIASLAFLKGDTVAIPFRRGLQKKGGMPNDFDMSQHKLEQLKGYFQKVTNLLNIHLDLKKAFPAYPDIRHKIGNILMLLGRRDEAIADLFDYIEVFYNRSRRHSTLCYRLPIQFLQDWITKQRERKIAA